MVCIVDASPSTPASVIDVPITSAKRLRTVTGTVAELRELAGDLGDDYLRVVVKEPTRAGLRDEVVEALPNALEIRIDPAFIKARTNSPSAHVGKSPRAVRHLLRAGRHRRCPGRRLVR